MNLFFTLLSFLAVLAIAAFFTLKFKIPTGVSPITSVGFTVLYFTFLGCFDGLLVGGYLYFALAALACLYVAKGIKGKVNQFLTPSFIFFTLAGALTILLFAYKQPLFMMWDEFSFWGTSVKLVKLNNEMYTTAQIGWAWAATQKPGLIMLGYFFEFFGTHAEWRVAAGVDILLFSAISAVGAGFEGRDWHRSVFPLALGFLIPFALTLYCPLLAPCSVYMSIMADIPVGMVFGGTLCIYYKLKQGGHSLWPAALALGLLTMIKDTAFPLAMVAAGIMCVDILVAKKAENLSTALQKAENLSKIHDIKVRLANCAMLFLTPIVTFIWWVVYLGRALNVDATQDVGGTEGMGMAEMLVQGIKQFFGIGRTEKYTNIMGKLYSSFFTMNLTVLGNGLQIVAIIGVLLAIAYFTSGDKAHKRRCVVFGIFSGLGFFAYYTFIGFCYVFVFKDVEAQNLMSYERYIYPYYIGWFLAALALLSLSMQEKTRKLFGLGQLAMLAILGVMVLRLSVILTPGKTFVDFNDGYLYERREQIRKSAVVEEYLGQQEKEKIFFIGQGDDGGRWFTYSSDLLPLQLEYSFGGGTICLPQDVPKGTYYHIRITQEELRKYIDEKECGYVFVERNDEFLQDGFGDMFSDRLEACSGGVSALYKVESDTFTLLGKVE
ncbi:MAG: hypothetical protein RR827_08985 [Oscillospiraceae bacterium]